MQVLSPQSSRFIYALGVASLLLSLCLGFSMGWFNEDARWAEAIETVTLIGFVLLTAFTSWQFRNRNPIAFAVAFGGIYAAAYTATGRLNSPTMILIGLFV